MAYVRSRPARLSLLLTCLCLLALAVASPTAAQEPQRRTAVADGAATAAEAAAVPTGITPMIGDFDGNGHADILWYGAGAAPDVLWFGHANRVFTSRATTLDIGYTRNAALRPDSMTSRYNPYGFVAHATALSTGTSTPTAARRSTTTMPCSASIPTPTSSSTPSGRGSRFTRPS